MSACPATSRFSLPRAGHARRSSPTCPTRALFLTRILARMSVSDTRVYTCKRILYTISYRVHVYKITRCRCLCRYRSRGIPALSCMRVGICASCPSDVHVYGLDVECVGDESAILCAANTSRVDRWTFIIAAAAKCYHRTMTDVVESRT